jgi:hypothetical protein
MEQQLRIGVATPCELASAAEAIPEGDDAAAEDCSAVGGARQHGTARAKRGTRGGTGRAKREKALQARCAELEATVAELRALQQAGQEQREQEQEREAEQERKAEEEQCRRHEDEEEQISEAGDVDEQRLMVPHNYLCPITSELMTDPVVAADGGWALV